MDPSSDPPAPRGAAEQNSRGNGRALNSRAGVLERKNEIDARRLAVAQRDRLLGPPRRLLPRLQDKRPRRQSRKGELSVGGCHGEERMPHHSQITGLAGMA